MTIEFESNENVKNKKKVRIYRWRILESLSDIVNLRYDNDHGKFIFLDE